MTPKLTTSENSSALKDRHKKSSKKGVAAELLLGVEVPIKNKRISSRTFSLFISLLLPITMNNSTRVSRKSRKYSMESKMRR